MPLSVKNSVEKIERFTNRFKGLPSKGQIRVKEYSRPIVTRSTAHIVFELNKLIDTSYPEFSTNNAIDKSSSSEQKEGHLSSSDGGEGVQREGACFLFFLKRANSRNFVFRVG